MAGPRDLERRVLALETQRRPLQTRAEKDDRLRIAAATLWDVLELHFPSAPSGSGRGFTTSDDAVEAARRLLKGEGSETDRAAFEAMPPAALEDFGFENWQAFARVLVTLDDKI